METFTPTKPLTTAVLMIIFNRPETTRVVFEAIRKARPPRLYVAADGPRLHVPTDFVRCQQARAIIEEVDWDCEVFTHFTDEDLGCGIGPSSGFTWFFEHEEMGIILEDDCLPAQSFFWFCEDLLKRYRNDNRIMHIGGNNFLEGWKHDPDYSYYFSRSGHIWGWATWRRAWSLFDYNMSLYTKLKQQHYFSNYFLNPLERAYRLRRFNRTLSEKQIDWWDYQWDFARFVHSGLAIVPAVNLVRNLGFGVGATHTHNKKSKDAQLIAGDITFPLKHPPFMIRDVISDKRYFNGFIKDVLLNKAGLT